MFNIFKKKQNLIEEVDKLKKELEIKNLEIKSLKNNNIKFEDIEKEQHVYILKCDGPGYKIGKTRTAVKKRIKNLQTGNINDIEILFDYETNNADLLERCVHYILHKYRVKSNREFFDCDLNYIKNVIEILGNTMHALKTSFEDTTMDEIIGKLQIEKKTSYNKKRKLCHIN